MSHSPTRRATSVPGLCIATANLSRAVRPSRAATASSRNSRRFRPVPGALDQIVQRFGTNMVAEVTGRSRRIIRMGARLLVETRAGFGQPRRDRCVHG